MDILLAKNQDIDGWMNLVCKVKENFPGLETKEALEEHRDTVFDFIHKKSAICARVEDRIVGALLFSKENNMLCFLAVDPGYRRQHIAEQMFRFMLPLMTPGKEIIVTTYREGVPGRAAARAFYQKLGFVPGKMTVEFGSEVQEFVMEVAKWQIS